MPMHRLAFAFASCASVMSAFASVMNVLATFECVGGKIARSFLDVTVRASQEFSFRFNLSWF